MEIQPQLPNIPPPSRYTTAEAAAKFGISQISLINRLLDLRAGHDGHWRYTEYVILQAIDLHKTRSSR